MQQMTFSGYSGRHPLPCRVVAASLQALPIRRLRASAADGAVSAIDLHHGLVAVATRAGIA